VTVIHALEASHPTAHEELRVTAVTTFNTFLKREWSQDSRGMPLK